MTTNKADQNSDTSTTEKEWNNYRDWDDYRNYHPENNIPQYQNAIYKSNKKSGNNRPLSPSLKKSNPSTKK